MITTVNPHMDIPLPHPVQSVSNRDENASLETTNTMGYNVPLDEHMDTQMAQVRPMATVAASKNSTYARIMSYIQLFRIEIDSRMTSNLLMNEEIVGTRKIIEEHRHEIAASYAMITKLTETLKDLHHQIDCVALKS